MKIGRSCVFAILACVLGVAPARGEFKFGHIYVSASDNDWCTVKGGPAAIIEIDPDTGEMTVFAHSDDHPFCGPGGLRFTPDGSRLLLSEGVLGRVIAFDGDGNSEILIPAVFAPFGMVFDAGNDLYVSVGGSQILRYPATGGSPTVFANHEDGLFSVGSLDFSPNGDLFWVGHAEDFIIRITPDGVGFPFDDPLALGENWSVVIDRAGNVFVGMEAGGIIRYEGGDSKTPIQIIPFGVASIRSLALSAPHDVLYAGSWTGPISAVDPELGGLVLIADVRDLPIWGQAFVGGLAVYAPDSPGDLNGDGNANAGDFPAFLECFTGPGMPTLNVWCRPADMDQDGDVDWADFGRFQLVFSEN